MTQSNSPSGGRQFGRMALAEVFPWLFAIDVFAELIGELKRGKEESWIDNLLYLLTLVGLILVVAPFAFAFLAPAGLAWLQGASLKTSLLVGAAGEALLLFWIRKKLSRDPRSRAFDRAQKILQGNPQVSFEDLCERVRKALGSEDSRALKVADDEASHAWNLAKQPKLPRRGLFGYSVRFNWPWSFRDDGGRDEELSCFKAPPQPKGEFSTPRQPNYGGMRDPMNNREERR